MSQENKNVSIRPMPWYTVRKNQKQKNEEGIDTSSS